MYEEYEVVAKRHTALYHTINHAFLLIGLVVVSIGGLIFYNAFGLTQILIIIGFSILSLLFVYGIVSIFLKIYENTLISTFLQNDILEASLDSCKIQVSTMNKINALIEDSK